MKFAGKITIQDESRGITSSLTIFITEREDIKPLVGMDWLQDFNRTIRNN